MFKSLKSGRYVTTQAHIMAIAGSTSLQEYSGARVTRQASVSTSQYRYECSTCEVFLLKVPGCYDTHNACNTGAGPMSPTVDGTGFIQEF